MYVVELYIYGNYETVLAIYDKLEDAVEKAVSFVNNELLYKSDKNNPVTKEEFIKGNTFGEYRYDDENEGYVNIMDIAIGEEFCVN